MSKECGGRGPHITQRFLRFAFLVALALVSAVSVRADAAPCFGNPPRQTEDPLSPPCVPYFDGDNGGSPSPGVTAQSITVVLYNDLGVAGLIGSGSETGDPAIVRTLAAQYRYHQRLYQLYGREVTLIAVPSSRGSQSTIVERRADARAILETMTPFATVYLGDGDPVGYLEEMQRARVVSVGLFRHMERSFLGASRPFVWSFLPERETEAAYSASFLCRKLYGHPARFSNDPALRSQPRRFALLLPADVGSTLSELGALLAARIEVECGRRIETVRYVQTAAQLQMPQLMLGLKIAGVTTVLCYCDRESGSAAQLAASAVSYGPEWYWDDATGIMSFNLPAGAALASFGVSSQWRGFSLQQQYAYRAYIAEVPQTAPDPRWNSPVYYALLNLFNGFQASGPILSPDSFERSMFTFNYLNKSNPYQPIGGYGPYSQQALGHYSFIDTGMGWWWDATGTPPGGTPGEGCVRVVRQGLRAYPGAWSPGDGDLFRSTDPCSQEVLPI